MAGQNKEKNIFWFVFDVSYSMGHKDIAGLTALERAQQAAQAAARALHGAIPGASLGVLSFSDRIEEGTFLPSQDFGGFRQALSRLKLAPRPTRQETWRDWLGS